MLTVDVADNFFERGSFGVEHYINIGVEDAAANKMVICSVGYWYVDKTVGSGEMVQ